MTSYLDLHTSQAPQLSVFWKIFEHIKMQYLNIQEPEEKKQEDAEDDGIERVKAWLRNDVRLGEYIDNFIDNGYDEMDTIIHTLDEQELQEMYSMRL